MKVAVTIGSDQAGDSAFVVWRGFEESIRKAAAFGDDGVELAMRSANDVEACDLKRWLSESGMEGAVLLPAGCLQKIICILRTLILRSGKGRRTVIKVLLIWHQNIVI